MVLIEISEQRDGRTQAEADVLRAAAWILESDAAALDDCEPTDGEFARLTRAATVCRIAANRDVVTP